MRRFILAITLLTLGSNVLAATRTWDGSDSSTWSLANNWVEGIAPVNGDDLVFTSGNPPNQPTDNDIAGLVLRSITFNEATFTGPLYLGGGDFTLDTAYGASVTIQNNVTTAGRPVFIDNPIQVVGNQVWATVSDSDASVTVSGGISGSADIAFQGNNSNSSTQPNWKLIGSNFGYTGKWDTPGSDLFGFLLGGFLSQSQGWVDLAAGNRNMWLRGGNDLDFPYSFWSGDSANSPMKVNFRNAGTAGLYLTGGDVYWNPLTSGNDFLWDAATVGANPGWDFNGSDDSIARFFYVGNPSGALILGGNRLIRNAGGGNNSGRVVLLFALSDDGTARNFTSSGHPLCLTRAADPRGGAAVLTGTTTVSAGALCVSNMNQIFDGNLNLRGGALMLSDLSWADFAADRTGYGTGVNQWRVTGGGFSARGTPVIIPNDTSAGLSASSFDTSFAIGSSALHADGTFYANAGVTIARDTTLTGQRGISVGANGYGFDDTLTGVLNQYSGNLSGSGVIVVSGARSATTTPDLILSGTNTWTGGSSEVINTGNWWNSGSGGMNVNGTFVVWNHPNAFPTGNGGVTEAHISAIWRNNSAAYGHLLKGDSSGVTYILPTLTKFVLGGVGGSETPGTLGATGGKATLQGSSVCIHHATSSSTLALNLFVRDGSTLTLGVNGAPCFIIPTAGVSVSASGTATTLLDATGTRSLRKRGLGTLALGNISYTDIAKTTDKTASFSWQIGRASANTYINPYFDGAVRETSNGSSNSLAGFNIVLAGGTVETTGTFSRALGTASGQVRWITGGGGFAAYGGPLTVNIGGAGATLSYGSTVNFLGNGQPLIFGSRTSDNVVTWENPINVGATAQHMAVYDNPNSSADYAVIAAAITGTGGNGFRKVGDGKLVFKTGITHSFSGSFEVLNGSLIVDGTCSRQSGACSVYNGATLGGSGNIFWNVSILAGGTLAPGSSAGTLTIGEAAAPKTLTLNDTSELDFELGAVSDQVIVRGDIVLDGVLTVTDSGGFSENQTYVLMTYTGTLTDNGVSMNPLPYGYSGILTVNTVDKQVELRTTSGSAVRIPEFKNSSTWAPNEFAP